MNRWDIIAERARQTPAREVLYFDGRWYSYADLNRRARALAARLAEQGINKGARVSILAANNLAHVDLIMAAPKLGCVYTPLNTRLTLAEQQKLMQTIEPAWLMYDSAHAGQAAALELPGLALDEYEAWLDGALRHCPDASVGAEDPHMILFTGGSTGLPKGAMLPYRQTWTNAMNTVFCWGLNDHDCVIQATPAFHAAINVLALPLLYLGGRVVLQPAFAPGDYLAAAQTHGASLLFMVPSMYQMLAEHADFDGTDLSCVRWAISGGAPCPAPVRDAFADKGIAFRQGYGLTEAGVNCFTITDEQARANPQAVGRPMLGTAAVLRDESGAPVAPGEVGELTLAGAHVFSGYSRQPRATAASLHDGWLYTGDLARVDAHGLFHITGRRKEMYISGGENVYPVEVENALYELPAVAECAVLGVPDARWGETGLAAIVLREQAGASEAELRAALKSRLAGYKLPRHFLFLSELPKSGAGKIQKPQIRELFDTKNNQSEPGPQCGQAVREGFHDKQKTQAQPWR